MVLLLVAMAAAAPVPELLELELRDLRESDDGVLQLEAGVPFRVCLTGLGLGARATMMHTRPGVGYDHCRRELGGDCLAESGGPLGLAGYGTPATSSDHCFELTPPANTPALPRSVALQGVQVQCVDGSCSVASPRVEVDVVPPVPCSTAFCAVRGAAGSLVLSPFVVEGQTGSGHEFGRRVEVLDFDGDAIQDLVFASHGKDVGLLLDPQLGRYGRTDLSARFEPTTGQPDRYVGAIGDLNGDGLEDFVAGGFNTNAAFVFFGRPSTPPVVSFADADVVLDQEFRLGRSFAPLGDIDGDGFDDAAVGDDRYDATSRGGVRLLYGGSNLPPTIDVNNRPMPGIAGVSPGDFAGTSLVSGADLTGDGVRDLLVGASHVSSQHHFGGAVYLLSGATLTSGSLSQAEAVFYGDEDDQRLGFRPGVIVDCNGDGWDDVVLTSERNGGRVAVFLGSPAGFAGDYHFAADADLVITSPYADSIELGFGVGAADLDGDGIEDLLIGAKEHDIGGRNSGAVYVVPGSSALPSGVVDITAIDAALFSGPHPGAHVGSYFSEPIDLTGDGVDDILVSALGGEGAVYLLSLDTP